MPRRLRRRLLLSLLLALTLPPAAIGTAAASASDIGQAIGAFARSPAGEFAPATIAKAQAYWGAAQLAVTEEQPEAKAKRLEAAAEALHEAKRLASDFQQRYGELLALRQAAREAVGGANEPGMQAADQALRALIQANEAGRLNEAPALAKQAAAAYREIVHSWLPRILDETAAELSRAAAAGAKNYAPQSYAAAKQGLAELRRLIAHPTAELPLHPRLALRYAKRARILAQKVKQWRRHAGSHEKLVLAARDGRLRLAQALGLAIDSGDPTADATIDELVAAIDKLKAALTDCKQQHREEIVALQRRHDEALEAALAAQRRQLLQQQAEQMAKLKQALQLKREREIAALEAKLERETFDLKRQARVRKLFAKDEAEILANVDGSLLIRLKGLGFGPNRYDIDARYFDLLKRLKKALEVYGERKVKIEGHTDNSGDAKYNQVLSLKRAEAVRDYLIAAGIDAGRLTALGYGEVRPIASNEFPKGRAMNRRIDVVIEPPHGG